MMYAGVAYGSRSYGGSAESAVVAPSTPAFGAILGLNKDTNTGIGVRRNPVMLGRNNDVNTGIGKFLRK